MRATDLAASVPWAIRPEALQQIFDIAGRIHEPDFDSAAHRLIERRNEIDGVSALQGRPLAGAKSTVMRGSVAVLPVEGPLFRYGNMFSAMSGASSLEMLAKDLRVALNEPDVEAILLHVDSPGGEVNGTGEFADMIHAARGTKPIWAYVSNEGCSAAYWIASACDRIVCAPTSVIGSIGVVAAVPDPNAKPNDRIQFVSSQSPNKRPDPTTDEGKAQIQAVVDDLAEQFVSTVARNRGIKPDDVISQYGSGGVMVGGKAVTAGLADAIGSFEQSLIQILQKPAPVDATKEEQKNAKQTRGSTGASTELKTISTKPKKGKNTMTSLRERLQAWMAGAPDAELDAEEDTIDTTPPVVSPAVTSTPIQPVKYASATLQSIDISATELENRQLRDRSARMEDELRRLKVSRIQEKAEAFWSTLFAAKKAVPAEEAGIVGQYIQAATDDEVLPLSDGLTRVSKLEASYHARPANMLMAEQVPDALNDIILLRNRLQTPGALTSATPAGQAMKDERRKELLGMTDLGQQVLKNGTSGK